MRAALGFLFRAAAVTAIFAVLAASVSGHRPPIGHESAILQFLLAGGSAADLCGAADGQRPSEHEDCLACQIAGAPAIPPTAGAIRDADLTFVARVVAPRAARALRMVRDPSRSLRGPPLA